MEGMGKRVFDVAHQERSVDSKIVIGLERISEAIRVLLWDHAKQLGLSPIQIQILIFLKYHREELANVSHLAEEFNLTKPTISDAVKSLLQKGLIVKKPGLSDGRSYSISLSGKGDQLTQSLSGFTSPIERSVASFSEEQKEYLLGGISSLIDALSREGVIKVQRSCFACRFYGKKGTGHYCHFLKKPLKVRDLRLDCAEFEAK